ncbi:MAG: FtsX-like permease family protein [Cyclobacteriaceae bacterium]
MFKNLLVISFRLISRYRTYSLINFFGLALGLFAFTLIYLYVTYELSYDRHNKNYNNIFRVYKESEQEYMGSNKFAVTQAPLAELMRQQIPEIERTSRLLNINNILITAGNESFLETQSAAVDPGMFDIFTFEVIAGYRNQLLTNPASVVLGETQAIKYFGSAANAVGKNLRAETFMNLGEFVVEAVIKDMPPNSHVRMGIIFQFEAMVKATQPGDILSWDNSNYYNYVLFKPGADISAAEHKLAQAVKLHFNSNDQPPAYRFQSLHDVYLGPRINFEIAQTGSMNRIYIFSCIAALILLIACINYTNMATAHASKRAKEIGLRKVTGARRSELIFQFLGEALFLTILAMIIACISVKLALPYFNNFLEKQISFSLFTQPILFAVLLTVTSLVGITAGVYPALVLSSLNPSKTVKGSYANGRSNYLRDGLVIVQFVISGALIFATLVVWMQMKFIGEKDLGFNREQIVIIQLRDQQLKNGTEVIKSRLLENSDILNVSASSSAPSQINSSQGRTWPAKGEQKDLQVFYCKIDTSFLNLYEINLVAGQNFSSSSHYNDVIINQRLVKELGYTDEEIIGTLFAHGDSSRVTGVVKDFHFQDFRQIIQPLRLRKVTSGPLSYLSVKVNEANMQNTLTFIEKTLRSVSDKYPFEYSFYDDLFQRAYTTEIKIGKMMTWFSVMAIAIASLGLYGLILFVVNQRMKEIGVRKVHGASAFSIGRLLSARFCVLVLAGYVLACGIGFFTMKRWLDEFAYRIPLSGGLFVITLLVMFTITGCTLFFRIRQATRLNPIIVLKHE